MDIVLMEDASTRAYDAIVARTNEPPRGKTNNVVFEQVRHKPTRWLEASNFGFRK